MSYQIGTKTYYNYYDSNSYTIAIKYYCHHNNQAESLPAVFQLVGADIEIVNGYYWQTGVDEGNLLIYYNGSVFIRPDINGVYCIDK